VVVAPLLTALGDSHADGRKAAVLSLAARTGDPEVREAIERATRDADADVRGHARRVVHDG
jgi:HEAT repeat protein